MRIAQPHTTMHASPLQQPSRTVAATGEGPGRGSASAPQLFVRPRAVALGLTLVVAALLVLSLTGQVARYQLGVHRMSPIVVLFDVNLEGNVPAWYSAAALLGCSALFAVIGIGRRGDAGRRFAKHWLGLSVLFLLASMDESASLHELLSTIVGGAISRLVTLPPYLYYAWVLVAIPFLLVLGVTYLRFLAALPRRFARWLIASAALYLAGAIGVEMIGSYLAVTSGMENMRYALVSTVEEGMEMMGIVMLLYAQLEYVAASLGSFRLEVNRPGARDVRARQAGLDSRREVTR